MRRAPHGDPGIVASSWGFATGRGDSRRAYRSAVDSTLQPYRPFIPESYDASKPTPLVVALHGMGGDENSLFDTYANGLLKREAGRAGFLVVCPRAFDCQQRAAAVP